MLMQGSEQNSARPRQPTAKDNSVRVQNPDDRQQTACKPTRSFSDDVKRSRVALGNHKATPLVVKEAEAEMRAPNVNRQGVIHNCTIS
jgi:hypothetical protein